jgi:dTDP-glucose 4,6-dehydratase
MDWSGTPVLVTGAGGFIGSTLCERLVALGARVRALVHYNALNSWGWLDRSDVRERIEVVAGDLADRDMMVEAARGADTIFHLGALIAIPYSYSAPESYVRTNVLGTLNVLQAARQAGVRRMIQTSTSEVYGTARTVPISENHPLQGQSPYSASKIGADKMAEAFAASFALPVVTVRPFNTFGPRQSARAVVPTIITQALAGEVVKLGNLHPTRDLNYVSDTVEGFIKAAEAEAEGVEGEVINLGSGREISVGDLAELIIGKIGGKTRIVSDSERLRPDASEVERLLADAAKAERLLGWKSQVTLEDGLDHTIAFVRENLHLYRPDRYTV